MTSTSADWLRLAENAHRLQWSERLAGWLATTARRECLRILRQAKRTPVPVSAVADPSVSPGIPTGAIGPTRARALRQRRGRLGERGLGLAA